MQRILRLVKEVEETTDLDRVAELVTSGKWVVIAVVKSKDSYLFALGRIV